MRRLRHARPSPALVVAVLALVAAVAGSAVAEVATTAKLNKKEKKQTRRIANKQINKKAPGLSVAEAQNATNAQNAQNATNAQNAQNATNAQNAQNATNAQNAGNADAVGGTPLSGLLRVSGCQTGKVLGFARVNGDNGAFPATYTSNPAFIRTTHNCSGQSVEVRRSSTGHFQVRFNGNPAALAVVSPNTDDSNAAENDIAAVGKNTSGPDAGAFEVTMADEPGNTFANSDFTILLP